MRRYQAMRRQWERLPPLDVSLAAFIGWKPPPEPSAAMDTEAFYDELKAMGLA